MFPRREKLLLGAAHEVVDEVVLLAEPEYQRFAHPRHRLRMDDQYIGKKLRMLSMKDDHVGAVFLVPPTGVKYNGMKFSSRRVIKEGPLPWEYRSMTTPFAIREIHDFSNSRPGENRASNQYG